ncbi:MAG: conserved membrane protein of unknown function [Candidatus Thorarchaeota archaeon]|nr:MAG: conserved membrane protein of unknown function [Candidatus Thorarchaeota archaeon]
MLDALLQAAASFGVGLYVAASPCLFPLLPLFLIRTLHSEDSRSRSVMVTGVLASGIILSLVIFLFLAQFIGLLIARHFTYLQAILGVFIIFVGILIMSERLRDILRISHLSMTRQPDDPTGLVGVFMVGFGYALLAAPCTGPALLALVAMFGTQADFFLAIIMFVFLCIGVFIPYLAIAITTGEARNRMASRIANSARTIEIIVGILLVIVGIILVFPLVEIVLEI